MASVHQAGSLIIITIDLVDLMKTVIEIPQKRTIPKKNMEKTGDKG